MKTDELISALASGAGPAIRLPIGRDLTLLLFAGMLLCSAISLAVRGLIPEAMWLGTALWTKLAYALALTASSAWLLQLLAFPAKRATPAYSAVICVGMVMAIVGALSIVNVPTGARATYFMGKTALICPWAILLLSLPTFFGLLRVIKRFAPTELRWTGAATGLPAGSIAAAGYALSCVEESIGFIAVWYSVGILLSVGMGAALGPRLLRW
jgi:hypothetical protein